MTGAPLLLVLLACAEPPSLTRDMPVAWINALGACEPQRGEARDWCALSAASLQGGSGMELYALCERLSTRDGYDRCIEQAMRHPVEPPEPKICARIRTRDVRDSCYAYGAQQDFMLDIEAAMSGCLAAGAYRETCMVNLIATRGPIWGGMGTEVMVSELSMVIYSYPGLSQSKDFGIAVGRAVQGMRLPTGSVDPCNTLAAGPARLACESATQGTAGTY